MMEDLFINHAGMDYNDFEFEMALRKQENNMKNENVLDRDEVRKRVGSFILEAREKKGWTRYELAKRSGMQETHIRRIEEGGYSIRVDIFNHLCRVLGVKIELPIVE